jgi:DNA polymerase-3 subunit delta'
MPFTGIVGQPRATGALRHALASGRLVPSLIFHGPSGVGKLTAALELARALLCSAAPGSRPCGACSACLRIEARSLRHPDVRAVFPETKSDFDRGHAAAEGVAGIDLQDRQAEAVAHPSWNVLIDRVRRSIGRVQRPPAEGARSVLIIDQAHRMEAEAANALLKTLEEPPPHGVLVLLTPSRHALLPTIRSRCQAIPFQIVPTAEITRFLVEQRLLAPEEAALRAGLSGGRIGAALELDLEEFRRRRAALLDILEEILLRGDPGIAVARAEAVTRGGAAVEGDLEILMTLLRDLLVSGVSPEAASLLINVDLAPHLPALAARLAARAPQAIEDLETTLEAIRRKGNRQLLLENFFLELLPPAAAPPARP